MAVMFNYVLLKSMTMLDAKNLLNEEEKYKTSTETVLLKYFQRTSKVPQGLSNNGKNLCYINALVQSLARTPFLEALEQTRQKVGANHFLDELIALLNSCLGIEISEDINAHRAEILQQFIDNNFRGRLLDNCTSDNGELLPFMQNLLRITENICRADQGNEAPVRAVLPIRVRGTSFYWNCAEESTETFCAISMAGTLFRKYEEALMPNGYAPIGALLQSTSICKYSGTVAVKGDRARIWDHMYDYVRAIEYTHNCQLTDFLKKSTAFLPSIVNFANIEEYAVQLPKLLIVRAQFNQSYDNESMNWLTFDNEMSLNEYTFGDRIEKYTAQKKNYTLVAVISNHGSSQSGHFKAYCRDTPSAEHWSVIDDDKPIVTKDTADSRSMNEYTKADFERDDWRPCMFFYVQKDN